MRVLRPALLLLLALALPALAENPPASGRPDPAVLELKDRLDRVALDRTRAYEVRELRLRRDEVRVLLDQGRLVFLEPVAGQVTGALFVGQGSVLVMPPHKVERAQLARFTGSPILNERFSSAYLRFTDATFGELLRAIEQGGGREFQDPEFFSRWQPITRNLNPQQSLRILADLIAKRPRPIFAIALVGTELGAIDVRVDARLSEQITIGQTRWTSGQPSYDIWCSFARRSADPSQPVLPTFRPVRYRIETRIQPTKVLEGETEADMTAKVAGERLFALELARALELKSVTDGEGRPLLWFDSPSGNAGGPRGSDLVVIVLPEPTEDGRNYRLRLRYEGAVIFDLGNGVLYVGSRGSWYPNLGMNSHAEFDMTFYYPRRVVLVATGWRESETTEEDWKRAHWVSNGPMSVAGFNLGDYELREVRDKSLTVAVYANRQLERLLQPQPFAAVPPEMITGVPPLRRRSPLDLQRPETSASPADTAEALARDELEAIRFFENYFGPFPYPRLAISQIPGNFGQGWPGLLYLSTFSFLRPVDQARVGLSHRSREFFTDLVPFHETAHQWWGNLVSWENYRDQWISESLSSFAGLLYLEKKRNDSRGMQNWLKKYKGDLLAKARDGRPVEQAGPLWLGKRLSSSEAPGAYEQIVYGKGAWVIHMLRELYREPVKGGGTSDERFRRALREFVAQYGHRAATTEEFRRALEKYMPAALDLDENGRLEWFFDDWVYNTGIPRYRLEHTVKFDGQRYQLWGKIVQQDVSEEFVMPVPVYAETQRGKQVFLGRVVVRGAVTPFRFTLAWKPTRVLLDPQDSILAVIE